ncbi:hypothetical protein [Nonomuraea wenchangensis]|uniref:Uncharacterized protein n=1 Tax=Nonomuraea wenchangensis TaxID=568860 RepID=A0A1I0L2W5_9ACTN|nr:hypothetical protein [Nonomuraea wenchangensis]SEU33621.1 hypothetical protein SAMN05421811_111213 [Nonomuraea wenchangensis]
MAESYRVEVIPQPVSLARICMWVQAGLGAVGLLLLLTLVGGMEANAAGAALLLFAVPLGAILLIGFAAYRMTSRRRWVRVAGLVVESLLVLNGLWSLLGEVSLGTLLNMALAAAVVWLLFTRQSAAWFDR